MGRWATWVVTHEQRAFVEHAKEVGSSVVVWERVADTELRRPWVLLEGYKDDGVTAQELARSWADRGTSNAVVMSIIDSDGAEFLPVFRKGTWSRVWLQLDGVTAHFEVPKAELERAALAGADAAAMLAEWMDDAGLPPPASLAAIEAAIAARNIFVEETIDEVLAAMRLVV